MIRTLFFIRHCAPAHRCSVCVEGVYAFDGIAPELRRRVAQTRVDWYERVVTYKADWLALNV